MVLALRIARNPPNGPQTRAIPSIVIAKELLQSRRELRISIANGLLLEQSLPDA
ncbi:hypothetical protein JQ604_08545 [Bradyrhizobium jicamae]|uniref:hypothetical protein n=1 Tax=Bradyrhizobium jicamae TaxID=280332 RepID=UPI001BA88FDC|nr:hypothetical protein [Bradyrhizobium jicamae]MBR0752231.1 hypothetical protein [Bradyrhizobium jicamae]